VTPHTDQTYLHTEPQTLYGFWLALDDATIESGCLWFYPGSHANNTQKFRFIRNPDTKSNQECIHRGRKPVYDEANFVPKPVAKGSSDICVESIIHASIDKREILLLIGSRKPILK